MSATENNLNIAPERLMLLITIVEQRRAIYYNTLIQSFDVNFQVVTQGRGTAASELLETLGLTASEKSVIWSVVRKDRVKDILETLEDRFHKVRGGKGIAVTVPLSSVIGRLSYGFLANERSIA
ncbi:MAG: hypothetical protein IJT34_04625 [Butyrivibrio sp.]|nr:hypothetical protein [Butyrivibrio sp.]